MRPASITLAIFEKYSPEELTTTAKEMAQAQSEMESAEAEKKTSDGVFNERIKTHAAKVSELAQRYNKGGETAQIGCTIRYDIPTVGKKSYIRMDSEEVVEVHDMNWDEKQETIQFPLSSAATEKPQTDKPKELKVDPLANVPAQAPTEITFKDIQAIAVHIAKSQLSPEKHAARTKDMQRSIAFKLLAHGQVIGPDGKLETIDSPATADKIAGAWLTLAIELATKPPQVEEVTRICPYPGCILFAEHDGAHEFPATDAPKSDAPEPQPEKEQKPKRKKRGYVSPDDEIQPGAPA